MLQPPSSAVATLAAHEQRVRDLIANLGGTGGARYEVTIPGSTELLLHLKWLTGGTMRNGTLRMPARDFLTIDDALREELLVAVRQRFAEVMARPLSLPNGFVGQVLMFGVTWLHGTWYARMAHDGGDLAGTFAPLSPAYLARKIRLGQPTSLFVATGATLEAFRTVRPTARRTG